MDSVPNISQFTKDALLIAEAGDFLKKLSGNTLISELVPHTCDSVNAETYGAFRLRITQTRNRSKIIIAFTRGDESVCFMVKTADKRSYDQLGIITALTAAADGCKITVINMTIMRSQPALPVKISQPTHHRCHRTRRHPEPSITRKSVAVRFPASVAVAASA